MNKFRCLVKNGAEEHSKKRGKQASNFRQLEILIAGGSSRKLNGLKNEELLVHSERFVDSWVEETFIWILAASVNG